MSSQFNRVAYGVMVPDDDKYLAEVDDILQNETFRSMAQYIQHGTTTCLEHCVEVSYLTYKMCKNLGWNSRSAARAGLLHDMFLYDWHDKKPERNIHGFTHGKIACENACREFILTHREQDMIKKHMWPLVIAMPRYREAYALMHCDRMVCMQETVVGRRIASFLLPSN